jgi:hypothetical protein
MSCLRYEDLTAVSRRSADRLAMALLQTDPRDRASQLAVFRATIRDGFLHDPKGYSARDCEECADEWSNIIASRARLLESWGEPSA